MFVMWSEGCVALFLPNSFQNIYFLPNIELNNLNYCMNIKVGISEKVITIFCNPSLKIHYLFQRRTIKF